MIAHGLSGGLTHSVQSELAHLLYAVAHDRSRSLGRSVLVTLFRLAPMMNRTRVPHLCPVAGGVFSKRTREVEPRSPDRVPRLGSTEDQDSPQNGL